LAQHTRYEIVEEIGRGGMGVVYRARDRLSGRLEETRAAARLNHPNVGTVYDTAQAGGTYFLAMELVEGRSLDRVVAERGPLPVREACEYVRQAALGLQHAYEQGIVHRDIKPHNLWLTAAPDQQAKVKVLDFGLALVRGGPPRASGLTEEGLFLGASQYIAPEQARGAGQADIRADIYSLGCTLYYLLTGAPPFQDDSSLNVLMKHALEEPRPLREVRKDVPPALSAVVARMLAKGPADRYQRPAEVAQALAPFCRPAAEEDLPQAPAPAPTPAEEAVAGVALVQLEGLPDQAPLLVGSEYKLRAGVRGNSGRSPDGGPALCPEDGTATFDIAVRAPGMDILPDWRQQMKLGPAPGTGLPWWKRWLGRGKGRRATAAPEPGAGLLEFTLVPRQAGRKRIEVDYYHQRHWLAHLDLEVEVVAT
jgi:serine/threonine protein kinase